MAPKFLLSNSQVHEIVSANKYKVKDLSKFHARCIDGRYENSVDLPALAIPGADVGDLGILYAAANHYAFDVDYEKALETLQGLIGKENFSWHTDGHGDPNVLASGCGHVKQMRTDPKAYDLTEELIEKLNSQISKAKDKGGKEVPLKGEHEEGAAIIVKGSYGVLPQYRLESDEGTTNMQIFVFHQSLVDERHRAWAKVLIESGAVKLFDDLDEEYLYEVLSNSTENHLFETAKRLAKSLPLFQVTFKDDGSFLVEDRGFI